MSLDLDPLRGRGAADNPPNRFERLAYEEDPLRADPDAPAPTTQFFRDTTRSIIATNDSPDVGFDKSINPYRGCEHGCIYCYARPYHEYLGMSAGLDFESKIMVKEDAPELLRKELASPRWQPETVAISGVTDCYQPIERRLEITRRCLQVFAEFLNPVAIVTKSRLVTRDIDVLGELAQHQAAAVFISITTLDNDLARVLEPRAATPAARLAAIEELAKAGIPTGVLTAPIIPGLNDHEIPRIINAAVGAGAQSAGWVMLRLPYAVAPLFERWLEQHFPDRKDKVLGRIESLRGGQRNDPRFGTRMRGEGVLADAVADMFKLARRQAGLRDHSFKLSTASFRRPGGTQGLLFD